jgi:hypothetical protein
MDTTSKMIAFPKPLCQAKNRKPSAMPLGFLYLAHMPIILLLWFGQNGLKQLIIERMTFCHHRAVLYEVNSVLTSYRPGIKGGKAKEGFAHHISRQPVTMVILGQIPEELLLLSYPGNRLHYAAGEQVGESPQYLIHLFI